MTKKTMVLNVGCRTIAIDLARTKDTIKLSRWIISESLGVPYYSVSYRIICAIPRLGFSARECSLL